jgi:hypothetical protein
MRTATLALIFVACISARTNGVWRQANEGELKKIIPARAPVVKEHIETEFRTASAITDGKGHYVAGVVLITAGYAAEGKYSNFFVTQAPLRVGDVSLAPGEYVFGWRRKNDEALEVNWYDARSGQLLGTVQASRTNRLGKIASFRIAPPNERPIIQIGRFGMAYSFLD